MKKILSCLMLLTVGLVLAQADDPTTLQVAPSDQVKYPDPAELLNKTDPTQPATPAVPPAKTQVPSTQPLLAATPIRIKPAPISATPPTKGTAAKAPKTTSAGQWFLKWTLAGDEDGTLSWAQALNRGASVHKVKDGLWEVWAGPFDATQIKDALAGQVGVATLVKR